MDSEQIKSCMDALAARITEAIIEGVEPRPGDTAALTALAHRDRWPRCSVGGRGGLMRRYFLDTEFVEDGSTIMPISLGMVCDDGRMLYIEFDFDEEKAEAHDFVRENVLPHLVGQVRCTRGLAAKSIRRFMGLDTEPAEDVEVWAYFADYDWVLFCQIFGTMMDLPKGCPRFCMDLMQWWTQLGCPNGVKPPKPTRAHHALADAEWNLEFYERLEEFYKNLESH